MPNGLHTVVGLSPRLLHPFERCLSHNRDDRPTARELADSLRLEVVAKR